MLHDDSAEIGSVHDEEQRSKDRPLRNAIQDRHDWRQMTIEQYLLSSAGNEGREPPQNGVDQAKVALKTQKQQL